MNMNQRPELGTVVHLRPRTRTAGPECHAMVSGQVVSYALWPLVLVRVELEAGRPRQIKVHADDVGLHPAKQKQAGDQASKGERRLPKPLPGRPRPIELGPGEELLTLW